MGIHALPGLFQCHVQELLSTLQLPEPYLGCSRWVSSKMPFQPHFTQRARQSPAEASQPIAPLEATALLPSVTGTMIRGAALPTASVITHPGCAMRMGVTPACRKCQSHGRDKEEPAGGKSLGWLEKVGAAVKHQSKAAPKTSVIPRQNGIALPPIPREGDKDLEKPGRKLLPCLPACSSQAKGAPLGNNDMSPWMGPSQSEAAFHALFKPMVSFLHSVPFSAAAAGTPGSCSFFPELGEKALAADGNQRRRARLLQGKGKQKSRSRGLPRHFGSKWQGMTLPPVPSITNLNFSRNFTFSFFELPPHQSHEHWMQRQQLICLLMKQLK
ncbi:uncharacterized protein LOC128346045 isoform X1 [Hemicordylus capensis]|uniref:uncharacterized protein LOC128346045 isoform X1 n=1 Tax=Hemicordylus capensis TaxID=884348 RepID=UPI00230447DC|nr:uncharacterized protein LOC128346045 isoform X1 [Hemicordylus capensis]